MSIKDNPQIRPAPDRVKIWPFTAIDRPDGERAWSGGHWGSLSATMPHSTEYVRADLAQSALDAALLAAKEEGFWIGRSTGGSRAEIDAALRAIRE